MKKKLVKNKADKDLEKINKKINHLDHDLKSVLAITRSTTDRVAIAIIKGLSSIAFLIMCLIFFAGWISWNLYFANGKPFDPFPFPILGLMVSLFAIILSVSVLINQNRQGRIDEIKQQVEFEINVRAENEITKILNMLHEVHQKLGLDSAEDDELEKMKEKTNIQEIHQTLEKFESIADLRAPDAAE
jgi:uncharacterized membrane protein